MNNKKTKWYQMVRIFLRILAIVIVFFVVLFLVVTIPPVQNYIGQKVIQSLKEKTGAELSVGSIRLDFSGNLHINNIFIKDQQADTLLFLHSLNANIELSHLFRNEVHITSLELENLVTHLHKKRSRDKFNFQFIIDAFGRTNETGTADKTASPWRVHAKNICLKNIHASFNDEQAGYDARIDLDSLEANIKDVDLDKKLLSLNKFFLKNSSMQLVLSRPDKEEISLAKESDPFALLKNNLETQDASGNFPDWNISVNQFDLKNTSIGFDETAFPKMKGEFDPRHISISRLHTSIGQITISNDGVMAEIKNMSFDEHCGLSLHKLAVAGRFTERLIELKKLLIETAASNLSADASLIFSSLNELSSNPGNCDLKMDIKKSKVNAEELLLFAHALASNNVAAKFRNTTLSFQAKANGKIDDLNIENLEVSCFHKTVFKSHAHLKNLSDITKLRFDASIDLLSTTLPEVYQIAGSKALAALNLPYSFSLKGTATGKIDSLNTNLHLLSSYGTIDATVFYQKKSIEKCDSFNIVMAARDLSAGAMIRDTLLGNSSVSVKAAVSRRSDGLFYGSADVVLDEVQYNSYEYRNIEINCLMDGHIFSATARSHDPNIRFELEADADLHEAMHRYAARMNLSMLNMQALNFSEKNISLSTHLNAGIKYGGLNNSEGSLHLTKILFLDNENKFPVDSIGIQAISTQDRLDVQIISDVLDGTIHGNVGAENLGRTLQAAVEKYLGKQDVAGIQAGQEVSFQMNVHDSKNIIHLFTPRLDKIEISKLEGNYKSNQNELSIILEAPKASYSGVKVDTLDLVITGKNENLSLDLHVHRISNNNLHIDDIRVTEEINKGIILSRISIVDTSGADWYLFANELEIGKDFYKVRFLPGGLILNGHAWKVEDGNVLVKQKSEFSPQQFIFKKDSQQIGVVADGNKQKLVFTNFALSNLIDIVQLKDTGKFINGNLDGEIVFPSGDQRFINADLAIHQLTLLDTLEGILALKIKADNNRMDIEARLESDRSTIRLSGGVDHLSETPVFNLGLVLDIKNLDRLEPFASGALSEMSGKVKGDIALIGTFAKPQLNGYLELEETIFKINSLNFLAKIRNDKITLDNEGAHFNNFVIEDTASKKLTINGDVLFKNKSGHVGFDLNLVSKNFQPVNSTSSDNPKFFGVLSMNADVTLKGDIKNPEIKANLKIDSTTNLTYVLPGSELKLVTSEGIVQFIDSSAMFDSTLATGQGDYMTDSIISRVKDLRLSSNIEIDPGAKFTLNIDPKSGDYLTVSGKAKLDISSDGTGKQSINGMYEVSSGYYQLSFYDLIKKKFTLKPGSTISWSGRPMDADLNMTAEYVVRASSVALVANETSGMSDDEKKIFNQRLPYEVKLNIRGFLAKPEISFNITLPNQYLTANPLVATKLAALNTEEMSQELNKQVFALLLTGSFMAENPMATTGSSSNIASTAARNSVNGILSSQLNNMSSKYVSGVDLNFDLTSYEDYAGSSNETRTEMEIQVSKTLFNDRLTVEAQNSFNLNGTKKETTSSTTQQQYGQFAVIYSLTEAGEYKLRAYYQNAYDPFDGDITISGIAVMFEKEFESLIKKKISSTGNKMK